MQQQSSSQHQMHLHWSCSDVKDLDDQWLQLVDLHVQQHRRVLFIHVAYVRQSLQKTWKHERFVSIVHEDILLEDARIFLLGLCDDRDALRIRSIGRKHGHYDEQHEDDVVIARRPQQFTNKVLVILNESKALWWTLFEGGGRH